MLGKGIRDDGTKNDGRTDRFAVPGRRTGGIILAGMHAWGNAALDGITCRALLPVACRPLIWHVAQWLRDGGVEDAVVCGNSDTDSIRWRLGEGREMDFPLRYYKDVMPRGPAGCVRDAAEHNDADTFVVVEGAILPRIDLRELLDAHEASDAAMTLVVSDVAKHEGRREGSMEPVGIYVVSPKSLEHIPVTGYQDIKETLIPSLYESGELVAPYPVPIEKTPRVTGAGSYLSVNMLAVHNICAEMNGTNGFKRVGDSWVHETAEVDPSVRLLGSVLVGTESKIHARTIIVGPTAIGTQSTIEANCVVSRTIVWDHCTIGSGAVIDHSIVTSGASVRPECVMRGTVCIPEAEKRRSFMDRIASRPGPQKGNRHGMTRRNGRGPAKESDDRNRFGTPNARQRGGKGIHHDTPTG